ncbi:MAG: hypothetical protein MRZ79_01255 [Bacteroidia bacterium]|nr:hypothetical protein [Bacteroidia bacterium]
MKNSILILILLFTLQACEQKVIEQKVIEKKVLEVVYENPDVLTKPVKTDYDHTDVVGVINQLREYFPEVLDYHINVEFHYMNVVGSQFLGIQKIQFYVPTKIVNAYLNQEEAWKRGLALVETLGRDSTCLNVGISLYDHQFENKKDKCRSILIEYEC